MLERPGPLEARGGNYADESQSDEFSDVTSLDARALDLVLVPLRRNLTMAHKRGARCRERARCERLGQSALLRPGRLECVNGSPKLRRNNFERAHFKEGVKLGRAEID